MINEDITPNQIMEITKLIDMKLMSVFKLEDYQELHEWCHGI